MLGARLLTRVRSLWITGRACSRSCMTEMLICTNTVCIPWTFTNSVYATHYHVPSRSLLIKQSLSRLPWRLSSTCHVLLTYLQIQRVSCMHPSQFLARLEPILGQVIGALSPLSEVAGRCTQGCAGACNSPTSGTTRTVISFTSQTFELPVSFIYLHLELVAS